jgi:hypothetical protein
MRTCLICGLKSLNSADYCECGAALEDESTSLTAHIELSSLDEKRYSNPFADGLLALISLPIGLLYLLFLVTIPFSTTDFKGFLNSASVGGLYVLSIGGAWGAYKAGLHRSWLRRLSLIVWWSILGGAIGVVTGAVSHLLFSWPISLTRSGFTE